MPLLRTTPLVQLLLRVDASWPLIPNPLLLKTLFSAPQALYPSFILCTTSLSHPPSSATCDPRYLNQSTSSNGSPFSITYIRSPLPYLEHLITLLLPTFTFNFLLPHTLPNSLNNFSFESATSAVSLANNSWFISNLSPFALCSSNPFQNTITFTSRTTPSIYTVNNHGDITQPCLNPTLTGKPFTHIISHPDTRPTIYIKTLHCFEQFSSNSIHS